MKKQKPVRIIDLFAGAGGFTLGFTLLNDEMSKEVFQPIWANDFNKYAADTYNANFGDHCVYGDIVDILENKAIQIPQADLVIGGPPCQGFSLLNKNREGDPRKELWRPYMEIVQLSGAKVFVMENVPQLLGTAEYEAIVAHAQSLGFEVCPGKKLCAADYGVPQMRYRAIIVGSKIGNPCDFFPPVPTHRNPGKPVSLLNHELPVWRTVRDAIGELPRPVGTEIRINEEEKALTLHFGRTPTAMSIERYKSIPEEGMNRVDLLRNAPHLTPDCWVRKKTGGTDLFGRMWWDRPSFTIRTEFFKPEKGRYLHPEQHRPITHREAARIQSFPDTFIFKGSKTEIAKQIGNAVPPMFAKSIARMVWEIFDQHHQSKTASQINALAYV
jgi:DNA (cytosine-5)-methyltransferase 1